VASERSHPKNPGFKTQWTLRWRKKIIPWISRTRSPYRESLFWRYKWVRKHCQGRDVLDVPCGMGWGTSMLKGCRSLVGVDICPEAIQEAKERYGKRADFMIGDMSSLKFPDTSFDVVCCLEGIEHVQCSTARKFMREAHRVLRDQGMLFLSSPYSELGNSRNEYHIHEYPPEEIKELIEKYFQIEEVKIREVDTIEVRYFRCRKRT
jgi:ubiquinone/menaquinone biosynthesis C-methylase UbiE